MAENSSRRSQRESPSPRRLDKTEFAWQSQDDFMKGLEHEPLSNPLIYEKIDYQSREWDNIPPIVPRYVIQLSKYMAGITQVLKYETELETVKNLRDYTEKTEAAINQDISGVKEKADKVEMTLRTEIQTVEKFADELSNKHTEFCTSLYYHKTVNQRVKTDEEAVLQEYNKYIVESAKPIQQKDGELAEQLHHNQMEIYKNERTKSICTPRLLSIKAYQDLFEQAIDRCVLRHRQDKTDEEIRLLKEEIEKLKGVDNDLNESIQQNAKTAENARNKVVEAQDKVNNKFKANFETVDKKLKLQTEVAKANKTYAEEIRKDLESLESLVTAFREQMKDFRAEVFSTVRGNREDLQEQITETNKFFGDTTNQLQLEIDDVRKLATEAMKAQEKELVDRFSGQFNEVNEYMTTNVEQIKKDANETQQKFLQSVKNIKNVCSNYFGRYENDLEELKIRMDVLQNKYNDWSRVLIEPATVNDARLFSVESRITEEEEMRIKEYEYLRDMLKKLLYSLEQVNMQAIDNKGIMKQEMPGEGERRSVLPNLLVPGPREDGKAKSVTDFNKTIEFMMMKRLHFLRNSLDTHNPQETTLRMRDNAARKRDERILELWNRDKAQPPVEELVQRMRAEQAKQPRRDFSEHDFASGEDPSTISKGEFAKQQQQLQQNSLFSSAGGPNTSISANNSLQMALGDSRLNHMKGGSTNEDDGTIGGSTQYPGAHDSISSAAKAQRGSKNTQHSPLNRASARGQKQGVAARLQQNLNKKKFTTPKDDERDRIRLQQEEISKRNLGGNAEPFWHDFNQTISDICQSKEAGAAQGNRNGAQYQSQSREPTRGIKGTSKRQSQQQTRNLSQTIHQTDFPPTQGTDPGTAGLESTARHGGGLGPIGGQPHTPKIMDRRHFQHKTDSARELLEHSQPMPDLGENSLQIQDTAGDEATQ